MFTVYYFWVLKTEKIISFMNLFRLNDLVSFVKENVLYLVIYGQSNQPLVEEKWSRLASFIEL